MNINDYDIFKNNQSSLQETSLDTSSGKCYMTFCTKKVVNFDKVKYDFLCSLDANIKHVKSVDALVTNNDEMYFIEFKNGDVRPEKQSIFHKAKDSILIFNSVTGYTIKENRKYCVFVLVYNEDENHFSNRTLSALARANRGRMNYDSFGFEKMKGFCYRDTFVLSKNQFQNQIVERFNW